jgi:hypothetical protein
MPIYIAGEKMLISERTHLWSGGIARSRSEGNLVDMEAQKSSKNHNISGTGIYYYCNFSM